MADSRTAWMDGLSRATEHIATRQKAEWEEVLASTSIATRVRLRQVAFKIMREAGIISVDNRIQSAYLSTPLRALIEANAPADLAFFPGAATEGGTQ